MVAVVSRAALRAEESHDAWLSVFLVVTAQPPDPGRAPCPNCGRFNVRFQYVADVDSSVGFCALWCTNCHHGHVLSRVRVPEYLDFLPLDSPESTLREAIPNFVDVAAQDLAGASSATEESMTAGTTGAERELLEALIDRGVGQPLRHALAPREREVATLVVQGLTRRDIADQLGLSPSTVQSLFERIYWKLGRRSATEQRRTT
jgi:DNA-binding CsgD family transcriptional regulator